MPAWANVIEIRNIYKKAKQLTYETGIKHEVDHIIPSNHPLVCGLHVENNLQILTEHENIKKSNSFSV
jgi:5-methylcytosine-specific restriction endonuclease McrA